MSQECKVGLQLAKIQCKQKEPCKQNKREKLWRLAIVAKKEFEKVPYPFVMLKKNPSRIGNRRDRSQSDKEHLLKTCSLNTLLLNLGTSQTVCSSFLFNIVLKVLTSLRRQERKRERRERDQEMWNYLSVQMTWWRM